MNKQKMIENIKKRISPDICVCYRCGELEGDCEHDGSVITIHEILDEELKREKEKP